MTTFWVRVCISYSDSDVIYTHAQLTDCEASRKAYGLSSFARYNSWLNEGGEGWSLIRPSVLPPALGQGQGVQIVGLSLFKKICLFNVLILCWKK